MIERTRRTVLGAIGSGAVLLAGCTGGSQGPVGFTNAEVVDQELIVEFDEGLDPETISVTDPNGESVGETPVSTGATRVSFDIEIPYEPGEFRIFATDGGDVIAETSQEIRPELEIVDVGVGTNRMDEMPEELGSRKEVEAIITLENVGSGPEKITQLRFFGDIPNPNDPEEDIVGVYEPGEGEVWEPISLQNGEERTLFSSTLPFFFEGEGVDCLSEAQTGVMEVQIIGDVSETISQYQLNYSGSDEYDDCDISIEGDV